MSTDTRWTYLVIDLPASLWGNVKAEALQEELNKQGRQGWELVNFVMSTGVIPGKAVFKKEA